MSLVRRIGRRGVVGAMVIAVFALVAPSSASAHFLGGGFYNPPGNYLLLGYTTSGSYTAQAQAAAAAWHSSATKLVVFPEDYSVSEEDFFGYAYDGAWWGLATIHPCSVGGNGCVYSYSTLQLNTNTLGSESDFIRQKVAVHEFGHGIGLAHSFDPTVSIMRQGHVSWNTPQQHDIDDVNALYPWYVAASRGKEGTHE